MLTSPILFWFNGNKPTSRSYMVPGILDKRHPTASVTSKSAITYRAADVDVYEITFIFAKINIPIIMINNFLLFAESVRLKYYATETLHMLIIICPYIFRLTHDFAWCRDCASGLLPCLYSLELPSPFFLKEFRSIYSKSVIILYCKYVVCALWYVAQEKSYCGTSA